MKRPRPRATVAALALLASLWASVPAQGRPSAPASRADASLVAGSARSLPALTPTRPDALTRALEQGRLTQAEYALERARSLFELSAVRAGFGDVRRPDPRSATMILRDLAIRQGALSPAERAKASAVLARPTDGPSDPDAYTTAEAPPLCDANACIHYVTSTIDAPDPSDANANGIPDYVEAVQRTVAEVWSQEVADLGYRPPKSDLTSTNNGGSGLIDIYVAELGDDHLYGYCTSDDPNLGPTSTYRFYDMSAYCVVDNDFSPAEFPPPLANGLAALQVTVAHEFFHAIQFGYDIGEDRWFMEASSTWMEDEVYDDVNDNRQYLPASPIGRPNVPLDANRGFDVYGDWIFLRYLTERYDTPDVIRKAWQLADASRGGPDKVSLTALAETIGRMGGNSTLRTDFADFGMVDDLPATFYEEGAAYPLPPAATKGKVTKRNEGFLGRAKLDHLTNSYHRLLVGKGVASGAKLDLRVDGPSYREGTEASVVVRYRGGRVRFFPMAIDDSGLGRRVVPFGKGTIAEVDLVLTNASMRRSACWQDPKWRYTCAAYPRDDSGVFRYQALLVQ